MLIGLIADTHGLLRPSVHDAFAGVDLILHAGDVGGDLILDELETIAPVRAVFGNTDPPDSKGLVPAIDATLGGVTVHVSHGHELGAPRLELLLAAYSASVIVYGHTHKQLVHRSSDGRLVINPGAAGPRRFDLQPSVALLTADRGIANVRFVPLAGDDPPDR
jgi:putative phosphoesterase